ncbi:hypothetical protein ACFYUY_37595 [Kitasatospora sp. NPDC004745]|uniref:hypothetical protein n=1 Tax=Kitasatospora sp. NPDC004745 TaxID=3364019 RepID=UPI003675CC8A
MVALTVHTGGPAALDPDGATDAALARTGAVAMAVLAAVAALLWRRHQVTVGRPGGTGGWRRAAVAASVVHLVPVLAVIALAPWSWKAPLIAFACAVITCGVQEAASAAAPAGGRAVRPVPTSA